MERLRFVVCEDETTSFGFPVVDDEVDFICRVNFDLGRMGGIGVCRLASNGREFAYR